MAAFVDNYGSVGAGNRTANDTADEKRFDPSDGNWYTLAEMRDYYKGDLDETELLEYWESLPRSQYDQLADLELQIELAKAANEELRRDRSDARRAQRALLADTETSVQSARLDVLQQVRSQVRLAVDKFTASPVIPFSKWKFMVLMQMTYFTVWMAGRCPGDFWKWHLFQYLVLLPVQIYRWYYVKYLALMVEFCWVANFAMAIYLATNFICPDAIAATTNGILYRWLFALAYGPFAFTLLVDGNALVPHSFNHQAQLLIHMQPLITAYTLKFGATVHPTVNPVFAANDEVRFSQYAIPPLIFVLLHQCLHSFFFLAYGINMPEGWRTSFRNVFSRTNAGQTIYTRAFGRTGDGGSERLRFLKLEVVSGTSMFLLTLPTFLLYSAGNGIPTLCVLMLCATKSAWDGAVWYVTHIQGVTGTIDTMIKQQE